MVWLSLNLGIIGILIIWIIISGNFLTKATASSRDAVEGVYSYAVDYKPVKTS